MGRQPQYVMVTKERRKSGCVAGFFHLIGGIFTLGMWPAMVWIAHLIGPKKKASVTKVYGAAERRQASYPYTPQQPTAPQSQLYPPPYRAQQDQPVYPQQPAPPITYSAGSPQPQLPQDRQQPPEDPWASGDMRRR